MKRSKATNAFIIGTFVTLYVVVSIISTIHVIDFFRLSNPEWLAVSLAIAFEIGAAASLAALIALDKMSKWMVWGVFVILTGMQMMGNTYYTYTHLQDYTGWIELFGLVDEDPIFQKRVLSIISGAILPVIALGFIKSLVDYIKPSDETQKVQETANVNESAPAPAVTKDEAESPSSQVTEEAPEEVEEDLENGEDELTFDPPNEELVRAAKVYNSWKENEDVNEELTQEDIENYKKKTIDGAADAPNPQVMPGVN